MLGFNGGYQPQSMQDALLFGVVQRMMPKGPLDDAVKAGTIDIRTESMIKATDARRREVEFWDSMCVAMRGRGLDEKSPEWIANKASHDKVITHWDTHLGSIPQK